MPLNSDSERYCSALLLSKPENGAGVPFRYDFTSANVRVGLSPSAMSSAGDGTLRAGEGTGEGEGDGAGDGFGACLEGVHEGLLTAGEIVIAGEGTDDLEVVIAGEGTDDLVVVMAGDGTDDL